jgi:hypothetical protein
MSADVLYLVVKFLLLIGFQIFQAQVKPSFIPVEKREPLTAVIRVFPEGINAVPGSTVVRPDEGVFISGDHHVYKMAAPVIANPDGAPHMAVAVIAAIGRLRILVPR